MDVGRIISRAWEITWRWKVLWVLGFLAALGQVTSSGANSSYQFSGSELQNGRLPNFNLPPMAGGLVAGLGCLAFLIAIALWVISVVARGGLIAGVAQVEEQGSTTFGRAWAVGQRRFWTLFGIGVLTVLPILLLVLAMVIGAFLIAGGAAYFSSQGNQGLGGVAAGLLACICPSVCLLVILAAVLSQIRIFAERAAILENLGWLEAFGRGWRVLRENLGTTIVLWVVFLVLGLIVGAITLAILAPIFLPLAAMSGSNAGYTTSSVALFGLVCGLGLVGMVIGAIVGAVINTFTSATWTVAYREMTGPRGPVAPPSEPLAPPSGPVVEG